MAPQASHRWGARFALALIVVVPLAITPELTYDAFNLPKLALLLAMVPIALLIAARQRFEGARQMMVPALALGIPLLLSWLWSPYRGWAVIGQYTSYQGLVPYLLVIAVGVAVAVIFRGDPWAPLNALIVSASLASIYAISQRFGVDPVSWSRYGSVLEASSVFGNPNFAGSFFAVVVPLSVVGIARGPRLPYGISFVLITGGLLAAASEGAVLAALGGAFIVLGLLLLPRVRWAFPLGATLAALCAVVIVGAVAAGQMSEAIADRSQPIRDRGWFWIAAGGTFLHDPIVGNGPNSFALEGVSHRPIEDGIQDGFGFPLDPHSAPLALLSSNGVLALVGFAVLFAWVLRAGAAVPTDPVRAAAFGGAIAYFIQSLWATEQLAVRFALWILIGVLAVMRPRTDARAKDVPLARHLVSVTLAVGLIVGSVSAFSMLAADRDAWRGIRAMAAGDVGGSVRAFAHAVEKRPDPEYRKLLGTSLGRLGARSGDLEDVVPLMDRAFSYVDELPDVPGMATWATWMHRTANGSSEREERALDLFARAVERDPVNPLIRVGMSDVLVALGRAEEAHDLLIPLFFYFPPQAEFWGALAIANAVVGDDNVARAYLASALDRNPQDPRALTARELLRER